MPPKLGRIPSPDDPRDFSIRALVPAVEAIDLPIAFANRTLARNLKTRFDQQENSCVGQSLALMKIVQERRDMRKSYAFDPLWIWRRAKATDGAGDPGADRGTYIRAALEILRGEGASVHPQLMDELAGEPRFAIDSYYRLNSIVEIKAAIYLFGPVELGTDWFNAWFDAPNGDLAEPDSIAGGHATLAYGWDDRRPTFGPNGALRVANSWGTAWGAGGDYWMPYSVFADRSIDTEAWKALDRTTGKV
jgi:papain like protease